MDVLKTIIVGCGRVGVELEFDPLRKKPASHAGALLQLKNKFHLIAGVDSDKTREKSLRKLFPDAKFFTSLESALNFYRPDVVVISAWTSEHLKIFKKVIELPEIKGIVLEKPIARTYNEALELISLWERRKIPVVVNHERRWDGRYRFLKKSISEKHLGKVKSVYGKVLTGEIPPNLEKLFYEREGGGILLHDGTHLLDLFFWFFGDFELEKALIKKRNFVETSVFALFKTKEEKIPIFLESGGERNYFHFEISVEFEDGKIVVGNGFEEYYTTVESKRYTGYRDIIREVFPKERVPKMNPFIGPYEELYNAIISGNYLPFSSIVDGFKVIEKIFEIYEKGDKL